MLKLSINEEASQLELLKWTGKAFFECPNRYKYLCFIDFISVIFNSQDDAGRFSGQFHTNRDMHAYPRQCSGGEREEIMEDKTRERPVAGGCDCWRL